MNLEVMIEAFLQPDVMRYDVNRRAATQDSGRELA